MQASSRFMKRSNNNSTNTTCIGKVDSKRFTFTKKLANTLQGDLSIYFDNLTNSNVAVKRTNKVLFHSNKGTKNQNVDENILDEALLMKYLSNNASCPLGFAKFIGFFEDNDNYFLVQEYGGTDMFSYIVSQNDEILLGNLSVSDWNLRAQYLISQIANTIYYFHYYKQVAHLDISLENTLIGEMIDNNNGNCVGIIPKIIDFGLSQHFPPKIINIDQQTEINGNQQIGAQKTQNKSTLNNNSISTPIPRMTSTMAIIDTGVNCAKYVGKTHYKSPKVWYKQPFNAWKADVWSFGIMIFMMIIRIPPFEKPDINDTAFKLVFTNNIDKLLGLWNKKHEMPKEALDLLHNMLTREDKRFAMHDVINHPYIKNAPKFDDIRRKWGYIYKTERVIQNNQMKLNIETHYLNDTHCNTYDSDSTDESNPNFNKFERNYNVNEEINNSDLSTFSTQSDTNN